MTYRIPAIIGAAVLVLIVVFYAGGHFQKKQLATQTAGTEATSTTSAMAAATTSDNVLPAAANSKPANATANAVASTDPAARVTVTSVVGLRAQISYRNLPVGTNLRIIGVTGAAQPLPVTTTSFLPVPGGYSRNSIWEQDVSHASGEITAALPSGTEYGSYVIEASLQFRTFLRTPAFQLGADQLVGKPSCWMTYTPSVVKVNETTRFKWGSTGAEYAITPSGSQIAPEGDSGFSSSFPMTQTESLTFVGRGGRVSCSAQLIVK